MSKSYYHSYEDRYKKVYDAGIELWGNSRNDKILVNVLTEWVNANNLVGKKVAEFACGEGEIGVILSELGCHYHGFDIAPSAVQKANKCTRRLFILSPPIKNPCNKENAHTRNAVQNMLYNG